MSHRPPVRRVKLVLGLSLLAGACSLPADEGVTPIAADELPPEIVNTTTTTTTTTVPPTTVPETSISPEPPVTTTTTTTTTLAPVTTLVDIFYTDSATDGVQRVTLPLLGEISLDTVIGQLEAPTIDLDAYNVGTALPAGLIANTALDRAVLTVSLDGAAFDAMSDEQKREAIAQMVLTFTSFTVPGEGNIGAVILQVDGTPIPVYIPAAGTTTAEGTPLYFDDFSTLIVGSPSSSTTTTSSPEESVPPTQTTTAPPDVEP
jgi:hypothetical protein